MFMDLYSSLGTNVRLILHAIAFSCANTLPVSQRLGIIVTILTLRSSRSVQIVHFYIYLKLILLHARIIFFYTNILFSIQIRYSFERCYEIF